MSGDGRHDSMGHSAKYCAYTRFSGDNTKCKIKAYEGEAASNPSLFWFVALRKKWVTVAQTNWPFSHSNPFYFRKQV